MSVGHFTEALQEVMKRKGDSLAKAGRAAHVDGSQIGKIIKGTRKASKPVIQATVQHYDDGQLFLAAAAEVTGGASVPWLDRADLHPSSAYIKTLEEIREAERALLGLPITKTLEQLSSTDRQIIRDGLMEQIEAITALTHNVAVLCRKYDFSYIGLWKEHRAELKAKKYMK
ncbi:helix-turn-helix transcriptional regulator [Paenibacillus wynnii]|uniref:Transcriptional regulator n=1 Tax=Paenibacillus wynnii TaxID=268407 RepID=A0A098M7T3_9BACL|nr:helix-turn-helix transcriptional regulator [Paenibacillus wynnii]KGE17602.1 transcriptional regulator [Paenibacillus wynnii]